MTLDRSLKVSSNMARTRSVLTRAERIKQLTDEGKFEAEKNSPFNLPKVKVKHSKAGHKAKKEETAEGAAAAPAAEGAKAAKGGKAAAAAAPAKGAAAGAKKK